MQDPTLFKVIDVFAGLAGQMAICLVNTNRDLLRTSISSRLPKSLPKGHAVIVPATELALKHVGRPVPNAALLGAFAALTPDMFSFSTASNARSSRRFPARSGPPILPPPGRRTSSSRSGKTCQKAQT